MFNQGDRLKILLGLIALGGLLTGGEIHRFERDAAADVASKLGGAHKTVRLRTVSQGPFGLLRGDVRRGTIEASDFDAEQLPLLTEPERPKNGTLRELRLVLNRFTLAGLRIERLEATIPDCRFDLNLAKREHKIRLSRSGTGTGLVEVREKDLEAFVLHKYREIKAVTIHLANGKAVVDGEGEFLLVRTHFHVVANLVAATPRQLALTEAQVSFDGKDASSDAADALLKALNPVVDLDQDLRLHGAIDVEAIHLEDGELVATGKTRIPER